MYRSEFPIFFLVALIAGLPTLGFSLLTGTYKANGGLINSFSNLSANGGAPPVLTTPADLNVPALLVGFLVFVVAVPFLIGAPVATAISVAEGQEVTFGSVINRVLSRYGAIWALGALEVLAFVGIFIVSVVLFIIPIVGILLFIFGLLPVIAFIYIRWAVAFPVLFAENARPAKALGRSWRLVERNWWRVFAILFLAGIMLAFLELAISFLFGLLAFVIPGLDADARGAVSVLASTIGSATITPISAIITVLIYFDLRVRREGADLDQLAMGAALPPPASADDAYWANKAPLPLPPAAAAPPPPTYSPPESPPTYSPPEPDSRLPPPPPAPPAAPEPPGPTESAG